ncbi:hypothetical protein MKEN_00749400 [Mycena kentingensis (nom. inval.)]|nr:hypothetical protein MKEN_00749400 [Mycena kentingensis (nom. inval.)]
MCRSLAALLLLLASASVSAIDCPATDKDGTALVSSQGQDDFVVCTYEGAGPCSYFPANGSFSSGSSQCPVGIAQDPSNTTEALSQVGGGGEETETTISAAGGDSATLSEPGTTGTPVSPPATGTTAPTSASAISTLPASTTATPSPSTTGAAAAVHGGHNAVVLFGGALLGALWL